MAFRTISESMQKSDSRVPKSEETCPLLISATISTSCIARGMPCSELAKEPPTKYGISSTSKDRVTLRVISTGSARTKLVSSLTRIPLKHSNHRVSIQPQGRQPESLLPLRKISVLFPYTREGELLNGSRELRDAFEFLLGRHLAIPVNQYSLNFRGGITITGIHSWIRSQGFFDNQVSVGRGKQRHSQGAPEAGTSGRPQKALFPPLSLGRRTRVGAQPEGQWRARWQSDIEDQLGSMFNKRRRDGAATPRTSACAVSWAHRRD